MLLLSRYSSFSSHDDAEEEHIQAAYEMRKRVSEIRLVAELNY